MSPTAKVYQLYLRAVFDNVDQDVLVLDVSVDDPQMAAGQHGLDDLPEEPLGHELLQTALVRDVIEEIFTGQGSLQDEDVGIGTLVKVQEPDHPGDGGHLAEEADLQGNGLSVILKNGKKRKEEL